MESLGESKASSMMKGAVGKIPASDQEVSPNAIQVCSCDRAFGKADVKISRMSRKPGMRRRVRSVEACRTRLGSL